MRPRTKSPRLWREAGGLVVGVDLPAYLRRLDAHPGTKCYDAVTDIELISRQIQRARGNANYRTPILAGVGDGGAFAAVTLAQAPADTVAGAVSVDPTAWLRTRLPPCSQTPAAANSDGGFSYGPWKSLDGFWVVGFDAADSAGRRDIQHLQAAGTPVEISKIAEESSTSQAIAALLRPHLGVSLGPAKPVISNLPLSNCRRRRMGIYWQSYFRATAAGAISTRRSPKNCSLMVFRSSAGTVCAISGATNRPSRPRGIWRGD